MLAGKARPATWKLPGKTTLRIAAFKKQKITRGKNSDQRIEQRNQEDRKNGDQLAA